MDLGWQFGQICLPLIHVQPLIHAQFVAIFFDRAFTNAFDACQIINRLKTPKMFTIIDNVLCFLAANACELDEFGLCGGVEVNADRLFGLGLCLLLALQKLVGLARVTKALAGVQLVWQDQAGEQDYPTNQG